MKTILIKCICFLLGLFLSLPYLALQWAKVCYSKKQPPWKLIG